MLLNHNTIILISKIILYYLFSYHIINTCKHYIIVVYQQNTILDYYFHPYTHFNDVIFSLKFCYIHNKNYKLII